MTCYKKQKIKLLQILNPQNCVQKLSSHQLVVLLPVDNFAPEAVDGAVIAADRAPSAAVEE